jgi:hypothetical protein
VPVLELTLALALALPAATVIPATAIPAVQVSPATAAGRPPNI